jgi:transposase
VRGLSTIRSSLTPREPVRSVFLRSTRRSGYHQGCSSGDISTFSTFSGVVGRLSEPPEHRFGYRDGLRIGKTTATGCITAVIEHIAVGETTSGIYRATGVSRNTVTKLRVSLEYWGVPYPPGCLHLGRPTTLRQSHLDGLKQYLAGRPHAYLEEMKDWLYDQYDIETMLSTVYRALIKLQYSRKIATKRATEQSDAPRRVYVARSAQNYTANMIVAPDESACNERTGDRKYGWSAIYSTVELEYSFKRSERWSLLPALTVDGYLNCVIFQGTITSEIVEFFLENEVLPHCNRFPAPNSALVIDNASIHRSARMRELCKRVGVVLKYLPPYSPDYNPIKKSFKQLKS